MKKYLVLGLFLVSFSGCFQQPKECKEIFLTKMSNNAWYEVCKEKEKDGLWSLWIRYDQNDSWTSTDNILPRVYYLDASDGNMWTASPDLKNLGEGHKKVINEVLTKKEK